MSSPTPQDYNEAVQNPHFNIRDAELAGGNVEMTPIGLPKVSSGNFASVYQFHCGTSDFAVRCFLQNFRDQADRYAKVSQFVMADRLPYTVNAQYIEQGIRIHGSWYPILKMDWVQGESLDAYVKRNVENRNAIGDLSARFIEMLADLRLAGIAHGDLQHGNILVLANGQLRLVDYDNMYVPALSGLESHELGHRNYQHPERDSHDFDCYLDNFSAWSIHTSLHCLSVDPSLLQRIRGGDECLLFRHADYKYPLRSRTFYALENHESPLVKESALLLRSLLERSVAEIPYLGEPVDAPINLPALHFTGSADSVLEDADLLDWRELVDPAVLDHVQQSELTAFAGGANPQSSDRWPTVNEYILSFSNPPPFFTDMELKMSRTERTAGKICPLLSQNSAVFRMNRSSQSFAVKVFLGPDNNRDERYAELANYLKQSQGQNTEFVKFMVPFEYSPNGINVYGRWFPTLKMWWIEGKTLEQLLVDGSDHGKLEVATHQFRSLIALMKKAGAIHGDIESTNIMQSDQGLRLLDYDSMYTPGMTVPQPIAAREKVKHPLCHPESTVNDSFAAWVLDTALVVIGRDPRLARHASEGRLLFGSSDVQGTATVLMEQRGRKDFCNRGQLLHTLSQIDPAEIPDLNWSATVPTSFAEAHELPFEPVSPIESTVDGPDLDQSFLSLPERPSDPSNEAVRQALRKVDSELSKSAAVNSSTNSSALTETTLGVLVLGGMIVSVANLPGLLFVFVILFIGLVYFVAQRLK